MLRRIEVCAIVLMGAVCSMGVAQEVAVRNVVGLSSDSGSEKNVLIASADSNELNAADAMASFSSSAVILAPQARTKVPRKKYKVGPFSTVAVGFQMTSLGPGVEVAVPLTRSLNLRGGVNLVNMGYGFGVDGMNYNFNLHLNNGQASLDWFPFHNGFHISPGVLIYRSTLSGAANAPGGSTFSLGATSLTSSMTDPVHGDATLTFGRTLMPSVMFGFSNLIPRSGSHFSFPFEIGAAYMGHNQVHLNLKGSACIQGQGFCQNMSNPTIQQLVTLEQDNLNESIKRLQAYPILSTGFAVRF